MAKPVWMTRTEAEDLVELLEGCDPATDGTWRHDLAAGVREVFGMVTREEERERAKQYESQPVSTHVIVLNTQVYES